MRFKLRGPHYLNVPGTEWEQEEKSQATGKVLRKRYEVPMLLDPANPADCNRDGECIVSMDGHEAERGDIIFLGDPTPDMEPLDKEAIALVESIKHKWVHPIESLSGTYGETLQQLFEREIAKLQSATGAKPDQVISEMQKQINALTAQLTAFMTAGKSGDVPVQNGTAPAGTAGVKRV